MRRMSLTGLKIGVTALSFEGLMEGLKLGVKESAIFFDYMSLVKKAVENSFKHVELTGDMYYLSPGSFSAENIEEWRSMQKDGITFSVHLPIWSIELDSPVEDIRIASINAVVKPVRMFEELKPPSYVLHVAGPLAAEVSRLEINPVYKQLFFEVLAQKAAGSVEHIVKAMRGMGVEPRRIALESIEFPFAKTLQMAEKFNTSICIDTGHILAGYSGEISVEEALKKSSGRLKEIHLHDAYRRVEGDRVIARDHLPIGAGDLDVQSFLETLGQVGFKGPIVFELGLRDAKASLQKLAASCHGDS